MANTLESPVTPVLTRANLLHLLRLHRYAVEASIAALSRSGSAPRSGRLEPPPADSPGVGAGHRVDVSGRRLRHLFHSGVYRDPVGFPGLAPVRREGLFKAAGIRGDYRDHEPD